MENPAGTASVPGAGEGSPAPALPGAAAAAAAVEAAKAYARQALAPETLRAYAAVVHVWTAPGAQGVWHDLAHGTSAVMCPAYCAGIVNLALSETNFGSFGALAPSPA